MIERRGKYGLTHVIDTCKIGGFLPFSMVYTNVLNSCVAAAGDAGAAGQCCQAAGAAGNSKLLEQPTSIMLAGCHLTTPGAPGNKSCMIYYNRKTWFGTAQYRNGVIHKIFVNVLGRPTLVWYNKNS